MLEYKIIDLAKFLNAEIIGDSNVVIYKLNEIQKSQKGDLTFIANVKYTKYLAETKASAIIIDKNLTKELPKNKTFLVVENSYEAFMKIANLLDDYKKYIKYEIHRTAVIEDNVSIGKNVSIGANVIIEKNSTIGDNTIVRPGAFIGRNCHIGKNCIIHPNVTILRETQIGNNCIIHSGTVIGSDGYGFATMPNGTHKKIPQLGKVIIEDDVEIGSNVSIDRAAINSTVIGKGTKIDNLVQIAHNVEIGHNNLIVAQVGISGSTKTGTNVTLAGQVGIAGHIKLGDNVIIGAKSGIHNDVKPNNILSGNPAVPHKLYLKISAALKKLPDLIKRVAKLEKELNKNKGE